MFLRKIIGSCTAAAILSVVILNCTLFTDFTQLTVVFSAEEIPWEQEGGVDSYVLVYPDPSGDGRSLVRTGVEPGTRNIGITIRKGTAVPVVLYPNGNLKPVGGVFPLDLADDSTLLLSKEEGFLAGILLDLQQEHSRIEGVNIPKLKQVIDEKSKGDPWSIDAEILKTALVLGSISVYKVKKKVPRIITFSDVPGIWISDNPFSAKAVSGPDGTLQLDLYPGLHAFLNRETQAELYVQVHNGSFDFIVKRNN